MGDFIDLVVSKIESDPKLMAQIQGNEMKEGMFAALKRKDAEAGIKLATDYCSAVGSTPQQMTNIAANFFSK